MIGPFVPLVAHEEVGGGGNDRPYAGPKGCPSHIKDQTGRRERMHSSGKTLSLMSLSCHNVRK